MEWTPGGVGVHPFVTELRVLDAIARNCINKSREGVQQMFLSGYSRSSKTLTRSGDAHLIAPHDDNVLSRQKLFGNDAAETT